MKDSEVLAGNRKVLVSRRWVILFSSIILLNFITFPLFHSVDAEAAEKKATTTTVKKTGFAGDPARKRGLELGYDFGLKAGKQDKGENKKPDPQSHEAYKKPEKYFRSEYGSAGAFIGGFKSGFIGGYQMAFGKKVPLKPDGTTAGLKSTPKTPKSGPTTSVNTAADAL